MSSPTTSKCGRTSLIGYGQIQQAIDLKHYDNLVQMLTFAGRINLSDEDENDVALAVETFVQAFTVSLILGYENLVNQEYFDNTSSMKSVFDVIEGVCEAIAEQIDKENLDRANKFYQDLIRELKQSEISFDWIVKYLKPIQTYLKDQPQQYLWRYVVESWDSPNPDDN